MASVSIKSTEGYVNYIYNMTTKGTTQVLASVMGMSSNISSILGSLAFQTSSYLSEIESHTVSLGLAAVGAFGLATNKAMEFQYAMKQVQAIGGKDTDVGVISQKAVQYSNQYGMALEDVTDGLITLSRAGLTSAESISSVMESGFKLATLEALDLNEALESLIATTNLLDTEGIGMNDPEYGKAVDKINNLIVSTSEVSPVDAKEIIQTLQHSGGYVAETGIDQEDLFATIAQLGSVGTRGEIAGTSLRAFMAAGQKDQAQRALERIGLSVSDLWDANGQSMLSITDMKDVIDEAMEAKGYSKQEQLEFYSDFVGYKQANQIMKIDTDSVQEYKEEMKESQTVTEKVNMILGTAEMHIHSMAQTFSNFMMNSGQSILNILNPVLAVADSVLGIITSIPGLDIIAGIGLFYVSLKALLTIFNKTVPILANGQDGVLAMGKNFDKTDSRAQKVKKTISSIKEDLYQSVKLSKALFDKNGGDVLKKEKIRLEKKAGLPNSIKLTTEELDKMSLKDISDQKKITDNIGYSDSPIVPIEDKNKGMNKNIQLHIMETLDNFRLSFQRFGNIVYQQFSKILDKLSQQKPPRKEKNNIELDSSNKNNSEQRKLKELKNSTIDLFEDINKKVRETKKIINENNKKTTYSNEKEIKIIKTKKTDNKPSFSIQRPDNSFAGLNYLPLPAEKKNRNLTSQEMEKIYNEMINKTTKTLKEENKNTTNKQEKTIKEIEKTEKAINEVSKVLKEALGVKNENTSIVKTLDKINSSAEKKITTQNKQIFSNFDKLSAINVGKTIEKQKTEDSSSFSSFRYFVKTVEEIEEEAYKSSPRDRYKRGQKDFVDNFPFTVDKMASKTFDVVMNTATVEKNNPSYNIETKLDNLLYNNRMPNIQDALAHSLKIINVNDFSSIKTGTYDNSSFEKNKKAYQESIIIKKREIEKQEREQMRKRERAARIKMDDKIEKLNKDEEQYKKFVRKLNFQDVETLQTKGGMNAYNFKDLTRTDITKVLKLTRYIGPALKEAVDNIMNIRKDIINPTPKTAHKKEEPKEEKKIETIFQGDKAKKEMYQRIIPHEGLTGLNKVAIYDILNEITPNKLNLTSQGIRNIVSRYHEGGEAENYIAILSGIKDDIKKQFTIKPKSAPKVFNYDKAYDELISIYGEELEPEEIKAFHETIDTREKLLNLKKEDINRGKLRDIIDDPNYLDNFAEDVVNDVKRMKKSDDFYYNKEKKTKGKTASSKLIYPNFLKTLELEFNHFDKEEWIDKVDDVLLRERYEGDAEAMYNDDNLNKHRINTFNKIAPEHVKVDKNLKEFFNGPLVKKVFKEAEASNEAFSQLSGLEKLYSSKGITGIIGNKISQGYKEIGLNIKNTIFSWAKDNNFKLTNEQIEEINNLDVAKSFGLATKARKDEGFLSIEGKQNKTEKEKEFSLFLSTLREFFSERPFMDSISSEGDRFSVMKDAHFVNQVIEDYLKPLSQEVNQSFQNSLIFKNSELRDLQNMEPIESFTDESNIETNKMIQNLKINGVSPHLIELSHQKDVIDKVEEEFAQIPGPGYKYSKKEVEQYNKQKKEFNQAFNIYNRFSDEQIYQVFLDDLLEISGINKKTIKALSEKFNTLEKLILASEKDLMTVSGIGPQKAQLISKSLDNTTNKTGAVDRVLSQEPFTWLEIEKRRLAKNKQLIEERKKQEEQERKSRKREYAEGKRFYEEHKKTKKQQYNNTLSDRINIGMKDASTVINKPRMINSVVPVDNKDFSEEYEIIDAYEADELISKHRAGKNVNTKELKKAYDIVNKYKRKHKVLPPKDFYLEAIENINSHYEKQYSHLVRKPKQIIVEKEENLNKVPNISYKHQGLKSTSDIWRNTYISILPNIINNFKNELKGLKFKGLASKVSKIADENFLQLLAEPEETINNLNLRAPLSSQRKNDLMGIITKYKQFLQNEISNLDIESPKKIIPPTTQGMATSKLSSTVKKYNKLYEEGTFEAVEIAKDFFEKGDKSKYSRDDFEKAKEQILQDKDNVIRNEDRKFSSRFFPELLPKPNVIGYHPLTNEPLFAKTTPLEVIESDIKRVAKAEKEAIKYQLLIEEERLENARKERHQLINLYRKQLITFTQYEADKAGGLENLATRQVIEESDPNQVKNFLMNPQIFNDAIDLKMNELQETIKHERKIGLSILTPEERAIINEYKQKSKEKTKKLLSIPTGSGDNHISIGIEKAERQLEKEKKLYEQNQKITKEFNSGYLGGYDTDLFNQIQPKTSQRQHIRNLKRNKEHNDLVMFKNKDVIGLSGLNDLIEEKERKKNQEELDEAKVAYKELEEYRKQRGTVVTPFASMLEEKQRSRKVKNTSRHLKTEDELIQQDTINYLRNWIGRPKNTALDQANELRTENRNTPEGWIDENFGYKNVPINDSENIIIGEKIKQQYPQFYNQIIPLEKTETIDKKDITSIEDLAKAGVTVNPEYTRFFIPPETEKEQLQQELEFNRAYKTHHPQTFFESIPTPESNIGKLTVEPTQKTFIEEAQDFISGREQSTNKIKNTINSWNAESKIDYDDSIDDFIDDLIDELKTTDSAIDSVLKNKLEYKIKETKQLTEKLINNFISQGDFSKQSILNFSLKMDSINDIMGNEALASDTVANNLIYNNTRDTRQNRIDDELSKINFYRQNPIDDSYGPQQLTTKEKNKFNEKFFLLKDNYEKQIKQMEDLKQSYQSMVNSKPTIINGFTEEDDKNLIKQAEIYEKEKNEILNRIKKRKQNERIDGYSVEDDREIIKNGKKNPLSKFEQKRLLAVGSRLTKRGFSLVSIQKDMNIISELGDKVKKHSITEDELQILTEAKNRINDIQKNTKIVDNYSTKRDLELYTNLISKRDSVNEDTKEVKEAKNRMKKRRAETNIIDGFSIKEDNDSLKKINDFNQKNDVEAAIERQNQRKQILESLKPINIKIQELTHSITDLTNKLDTLNLQKNIIDNETKNNNSTNDEMQKIYKKSYLSGIDSTYSLRDNDIAKSILGFNSEMFYSVPIKTTEEEHNLNLASNKLHNRKRAPELKQEINKKKNWEEIRERALERTSNIKDEDIENSQKYFTEDKRALGYYEYINRQQNLDKTYFKNTPTSSAYEYQSENIYKITKKLEKIPELWKKVTDFSSKFALGSFSEKDVYKNTDIPSLVTGKNGVGVDFGKEIVKSLSLQKNNDSLEEFINQIKNNRNQMEEIENKILSKYISPYDDEETKKIRKQTLQPEIEKEILRQAQMNQQQNSFNNFVEEIRNNKNEMKDIKKTVRDKFFDGNKMKMNSFDVDYVNTLIDNEVKERAKTKQQNFAIDSLRKSSEKELSDIFKNNSELRKLTEKKIIGNQYSKEDWYDMDEGLRSAIIDEEIKKQTKKLKNKADEKTKTTEYDGGIIHSRRVSDETIKSSIKSTEKFARKTRGLSNDLYSASYAVNQLASAFPPLYAVTMAMDVANGALTLSSMMAGKATGLLTATEALRTGESVTLAGIELEAGTLTAEAVIMVGDATAMLTGALTTFIEFISAFALPIAAAIVAVVAITAAVSSMANAHDEYLKKLKEEEKTKKSASKAAATTLKDLQQQRKTATSEKRKEKLDKRIEIAKTKNEVAQQDRINNAMQQGYAESDGTWGTYGTRAELQKMLGGIPVIGGVVGGEYKSTAEEYSGTSEETRKITEYATGNIFATDAEQQVAGYYKANAATFAVMDNYKSELGELYDLESDLMKKYDGDKNQARSTAKWEKAVDKFAESYGLTKEQTEKMLDYMETENQVKQARTAMEAQGNMIKTEAEQKVMAIQFGADAKDVLGLNGQEKQQEAMVRAQAEMVKQEISSFLWWKGVWSVLSTPVLAIVGPVLAIKDLLKFLVGIVVNFPSILKVLFSKIPIVGAAAGVTPEDEARYNSTMKALSSVGDDLMMGVKEGEKAYVNFNAYEENENTDYYKIGQDAIDPEDRNNYGNAHQYVGAIIGEHSYEGMTYEGGKPFTAEERQKLQEQDSANIVSEFVNDNNTSQETSFVKDTQDTINNLFGGSSEEQQLTPEEQEQQKQQEEEQKKEEEKAAIGDKLREENVFGDENTGIWTLVSLVEDIKGKLDILLIFQGLSGLNNLLGGFGGIGGILGGSSTAVTAGAGVDELNIGGFFGKKKNKTTDDLLASYTEKTNAVRQASIDGADAAVSNLIKFGNKNTDEMNISGFSEDNMVQMPYVSSQKKYDGLTSGMSLNKDYIDALEKQGIGVQVKPWDENEGSFEDGKRVGVANYDAKNKMMTFYDSSGIKNGQKLSNHAASHEYMHATHDAIDEENYANLPSNVKENVAAAGTIGFLKQRENLTNFDENLAYHIASQNPLTDEEQQQAKQITEPVIQKALDGMSNVNGDFVKVSNEAVQPRTRRETISDTGRKYIDKITNNRITRAYGGFKNRIIGNRVNVSKDGTQVTVGEKSTGLREYYDKVKQEISDFGLKEEELNLANRGRGYINRGKNFFKGMKGILTTPSSILEEESKWMEQGYISPEDSPATHLYNKYIKPQPKPGLTEEEFARKRQAAAEEKKQMRDSNKKRSSNKNYYDNIFSKKVVDDTNTKYGKKDGGYKTTDMTGQFYSNLYKKSTDKVNQQRTGFVQRDENSLGQHYFGAIQNNYNKTHRSPESIQQGKERTRVLRSLQNSGINPPLIKRPTPEIDYPSLPDLSLFDKTLRYYRHDDRGIFNAAKVIKGKYGEVKDRWNNYASQEGTFGNVLRQTDDIWGVTPWIDRRKQSNTYQTLRRQPRRFVNKLYDYKDTYDKKGGFRGITEDATSKVKENITNTVNRGIDKISFSDDTKIGANAARALQKRGINPNKYLEGGYTFKERLYNTLRGDNDRIRDRIPSISTIKEEANWAREGYLPEDAKLSRSARLYNTLRGDSDRIRDRPRNWLVDKIAPNVTAAGESAKTKAITVRGAVKQRISNYANEEGTFGNKVYKTGKVWKDYAANTGVGKKFGSIIGGIKGDSESGRFGGIKNKIKSSKMGSTFKDAFMSAYGGTSGGSGIVGELGLTLLSQGIGAATGIDISPIIAMALGGGAYYGDPYSGFPAVLGEIPRDIHGNPIGEQHQEDKNQPKKNEKQPKKNQNQSKKNQNQSKGENKENKKSSHRKKIEIEDRNSHPTASQTGVEDSSSDMSDMVDEMITTVSDAYGEGAFDDIEGQTTGGIIGDSGKRKIEIEDADEEKTKKKEDADEEKTKKKEEKTKKKEEKTKKQEQKGKTTKDKGSNKKSKGGKGGKLSKLFGKAKNVLKGGGGATKAGGSAVKAGAKSLAKGGGKSLLKSGAKIAGKALGTIAGAGMVEGGMMLGATLGSIVPGVGTVIGGALGAAGGFLLENFLMDTAIDGIFNLLGMGEEKDPNQMSGKEKRQLAESENLKKQKEGVGNKGKGGVSAATQRINQKKQEQKGKQKKNDKEKNKKEGEGGGSPIDIALAALGPGGFLISQFLQGKNPLETITEGVGGIIEGATSFFGEGGAGEGAANILKGLGPGGFVIGNLLQGKNPVEEFGKGLDDVKKGAENFGKGISDGINNIAEGVGNFFGNIASGFMGGLDWLGSSLGNIGQGILGAFGLKTVSAAENNQTGNLKSAILQRKTGKSEEELVAEYDKFVDEGKYGKHKTEKEKEEAKQKFRQDISYTGAKIDNETGKEKNDKEKQVEATKNIEKSSQKSASVVPEKLDKVDNSINSQDTTSKSISIGTININTDDDPESIKTALMNAIIELQEQISPRLVSRTTGEPNNTSNSEEDDTQKEDEESEENK